MPQTPFIMLDENSGAPIYRQIYEAMRQAILSGKFHPKMPLPPTRRLAGELGVARSTVINAYDQLFAEGYLEAKPGAGTFVAAHLPEDFLQTSAGNRSNDRAMSPRARRLNFSAYARQLLEKRENISPSLIGFPFEPFQQGVPALDKFPFEIWARIAQKWLKKPPPALLGYQKAGGFPPLREAIAEHLVSTRGLECTPEQVIITNGTQPALDLIGRIFLERSAEVYVEDPCYFGARRIFSALGARLVPVPIDREGFDLAAARGKSGAARLAYVTPSHQYPLGVTMSLKRRLNLLEWASETDSLIIEDDYNGEFRYAGRPLASLQGLDREGRVIYLGTFSKTIFPALRLGCLVVPPDLIEIFTAARTSIDFHSASIDQAILADFIAEKHFSRHLRRMRGIYKERQQILVSEARKKLGGMLEIAPAEAGMHLIGWLPEGVSDRHVARRAAEADLKTTPISAFCIEEKLRGGLFLGYTAFDEKQIKRGVEKLAQVLKSEFRFAKD